MFENSKYSVMIVIAIVCTATILSGYVFWYVSPAEVAESVTIIANTQEGCIVETEDGFPINIGPCAAKEGEKIIAMIDTKYKEREAAMNP
ncbi:hypothetical protein AAA799D11_00983 [Marine Group I thaumarchaeote SCGC AAA799-D11]|uniref:Uncharacterized protein n=1 Tax=Marine Group I thaumarchaeote SCGC AAA799-D11 TaxID=1502291 RepID=A0A087RRS0_9ARCH|nr:hypothetical protein AAA799D11_00983 [Marine Group I thaumarchaeote SCGC AAA799-D11]